MCQIGHRPSMAGSDRCKHLHDTACTASLLQPGNGGRNCFAEHVDSYFLVLRHRASLVGAKGVL